MHTKKHLSYIRTISVNMILGVVIASWGTAGVSVVHAHEAAGRSYTDLPSEQTRQNYVAALLNPPGTLDVTFDSDGLVTTDIGLYDDGASGVAIQADGKILIAGNCRKPSNHDFLLIRYNVDGSLDTSFDTDGIVSTDFGEDESAGAIAFQPDGKIVVAGTTNSSNSDAKFAVARYNSDGSLDNSFDTDGKVITNLGSGFDSAGEIALQPDGKIIVVGSKNIGINDDDIVVIRYNSDGSLDTSFDTDGIVTTSGGDFGASLAVQPDGKIIVGGTTFNASTKTDFVLVRYNSDGSLDTSFNTDGIVITDFGIGSGYERGGIIALQPDGKVLVAGNNNDESSYFLLARYNVDGSLDTSFSTDGLVSTYTEGENSIHDIVLQQNGKIVLAGYTYHGYGTESYAFVVARYNNNGALDTTFSTDGIVVTDFGSEINQDDFANSIALQADGKIVAAGSRYVDGSNYEVALARYIGDTTITPAFYLTTTKTGTGSGVVSSSPAGINCGTDCFEAYSPATIVTLTATPDDSSTFTGWSGACSGMGPCAVSMAMAKSVMATFNISVLPAPTLQQPRLNWMTNAIPAFNWASVTNADHYEIVIARDAAFNDIVDTQLVVTLPFTPIISLDAGKYYWHVRTYNADNEYGNWSSTRYFTVDTVAPPIPVLRFPAHTGSVRGVPTFRWDTASGAMMYQFEIDNDSDFSSPLLSVGQRTTVRRPSGVLRGTYYWRVRSQDAAGNWSNWSDAFIVHILPVR